MEKPVITETEDDQKIAESINDNSILKPGVLLADNVSTYSVTPNMISEARQVIQNDKTIPIFWRGKIKRNMFQIQTFYYVKPDKYEREICKNWNLFFKRNKNNFFKDRLWIQHEFTDLTVPKTCSPNSQQKLCTSTQCQHCSSTCFILDVGCGVGNAIIPILEKNPQAHASCFDCSPYAIELLKKRWSSIVSNYTATCDSDKSSSQNNLLQNSTSPSLGTLFCAEAFDILSGPIPQHFYLPVGTDYVLLLFVLSALPPTSFHTVLNTIKNVVRPGGIIFFRDYALFDMTQIRFAKSKQAQLRSNFYVRQDSTLAYYFTREVFNLFCNDGNFECLENTYILKQMKNRKTEQVLKRIWIQAKFKKKN
ncbi:tRNA N(3)-methylcytidine methyltransferase METTL6-like isoform X2 [Hylaeus volcanicus]|uniref:tRNA N(3)-methylcytidine methyltransferase METTL6-like isoform X2 n=1 Tax=Hylaeus volcanicus TaxID=313075 RepID=UPI0023B7AB18|nr:tRNA N(3)-methylcytidine methyltransferase METTL6-like isoform X2 [Hylaeus volcanicus]